MCVLVVALPDGVEPRRRLALIRTRGSCRGRIAGEPRGSGGFGYDPIFEPSTEPPGGRTLGLWTPAEKHAISHRARRPAGWRHGFAGSGSDRAPDLRVLRRQQGRGDAYRELAGVVGRGLAEHGIGVVYGGGRVGLMGALADAALAAGGDVIGVIPRRLVDRELAHSGLTRLDVVGSLHERKARMAELADGFIALPGGLGTLEELSEVASWAQLDLHTKPIGLLGPDRYWAPLMAWLDHAVREGFISREHRRLLQVDAHLAALLDRFERWEAPSARWRTPPEA